ncbi:MAG: hypothetical protein AB1626_01815 [Candidatus Micrarchaeota archaeon]
MKAVPWKKIVEEYASPLIHPALYSIASLQTCKLLGVTSWSVLMEYKNRSMKWCFSAPDPSLVFIEEAKALFKKLEDPRFLAEVDARGRQTLEKLLNAAETLRQEELYSLDNPALAERFEELAKLWTEMNVWGHFANVADFDHFMLTNKINAFLAEKVSESKAEISVPEAFAVLTTPLEKTPVIQQDRDFFSILAMIQSDALAREVFKQPTHVILKQMEEFPEIDHAIHEHAYKYDWLQFHYDGPTVLNEEYFVESLAAEIRQGVDGKQKLRELDEKNAATTERQQQLEKELGLGKEEKYWMKVAHTFMFLKALRKDAVFQASCWSDGLVKEIATRLSLSPPPSEADDP